MGETIGKWEDKRKGMKIRITTGENYLGDIPPEDYLDSQMESTTGSAGRGWSKIGEDRRELGQSGKDKGGWLQSMKWKKKKKER